jgi:sugar phosphate isomerase/epimerase
MRFEMMKRREFLIGSTVAAGAAWAQGVKAWAQSPETEKRDRIAVMTLAFTSILKDPEHPDDPARTLDILDTPDMIASHYGIHHVEVQHTHFISTELPYLREFRDRLRKANSRMNQICLEFGSLNISSPDPILRVETIDLTKQWIDHAVVLGCPRVMVNQGTLAPEVRQAAIETLKTMNEYGKSRNVFVTMENRGGGRRPSTPPAAANSTAGGAPAAAPAGGSSHPQQASWDVVVDVIKAAGIHANPDTGNFPDEEARAAGLRAMYPLSSGSSHVHYDPARFNEANAIKISKEVGYKGLYSIEASTINGPDPYSRVQTILDELLRDI